MTRCRPLAGALPAALLLLASGLLSGCAEPPRDLVLVSVAGLRDAGPGGQRSLVSSNDEDAVRLSAVTPSPETLPALAALMTGDPGLDGALTDGEFLRLPTGATTLAEALAARGYRTLAVSGQGAIGPLSGLARGFEDFETPSTSFDQPLLPSERERVRPRDAGTIRATELVKQAVEAYREADERPTFLWVHLGDPLLALTQEDPASQYVLLASEVENAVDALLASLPSEGRRAPVVAIASLHGLALGAQGEVGHGLTIGDAVVRVPLLVRGASEPTVWDGRDGMSLAGLGAELAAELGVSLEVNADVEPVSRTQLGARLFGWDPPFAEEEGRARVMSLMRAGRLSTESEDVDAAVRAFREAADLAPAALAPRLELIRLLPGSAARTDLIEAARSIADGVAALDLARTLVSAELMDQARDVLAQALPGLSTPGSRLAAARIMAAAGDREGAVAVLEELLVDEPEAPGLHELAGDLLLRAGNAYRARDHYKAAAEQPAARSAELLAKLGDALSQLGERQAALEAYARALLASPDYRYPHARAGAVLLEMDRRGEAADALVRSLPPEDDPVRQALLRAEILRQNGLHGLALVEVERALDAGADPKTLYGLQARLRAAAGDVDEAVRLLEAWSAAAPRLALPLLERARLEAARGDEARALSYLDRAEALAPPSMNAEVRTDSVLLASGPNSELARRARAFEGRGAAATR